MSGFLLLITMFFLLAARKLKQLKKTIDLWRFRWAVQKLQFGEAMKAFYGGKVIECSSTREMIVKSDFVILDEDDIKTLRNYITSVSNFTIFHFVVYQKYFYFFEISLPRQLSFFRTEMNKTGVYIFKADASLYFFTFNNNKFLRHELEELNRYL